MHQFLKFIFGIKLYMFWTVPLSIIGSFSLYTQQWYMSYRSADNLRAVPSWSCSQAVSRPVWHIPLLCVQWKTADDGQRNCPKHVEFYSKNKFEKLVHLVGFIVRKKHTYYVCFFIFTFAYNKILSLICILRSVSLCLTLSTESSWREAVLVTCCNASLL